MSEIQNKEILELTSLYEYYLDDAIPVLRLGLREDNCIALGKIIWYDKIAKQLIINGKYKFDMSSLLQANISIKLTGDNGITNFTYNNQTYYKDLSIESDDSFDAIITATVNEHYTFTKWQFENTDIGTTNPILYRFTESGELKAITTPKLYTITVNANDSSYGSVTGGGNYAYGSSRTIIATPNTGYTFVKWTKNGSLVSTNPSFTFTVSGDATYTAVFELAIPDYYVGQALNRTTFQEYSDELILSNCNGFTLSLKPIYPSSSTYQQLTGTNKLMYVLIKNTLNVNNIKVDINNPGETFDLNNQIFTDVFTYKDDITTQDGQYKVYWVYDSEYTTENGFRIKFNQL